MNHDLASRGAHSGAPYQLALVRDALGQGGIDEGLKLSKGARIGSLEMPAGAGDLWLENSIRYSTALSAGCYRSSLTVASGGAWTPIQFDTEAWDTDDMIDLAAYSQRITFNTGGDYLVTGKATFELSDTGYRGVCLRLNGTVYLVMQHIPAILGLAPSISISMLQPFNESDYIELCVVQNNGTDLAVTASRLSAARIA